MVILYSYISFIYSNDYTNSTYLAYVKTESLQQNEISKNGLSVLTNLLDKRTAISPKGVVGLDINKDEIYYFPFIYWPINDTFIALNDLAKKRISDYFSTGGIILFDVIKSKRSSLSIDDGDLKAIKEYLSKIQIKNLSPLPRDHTLSKSFYLLKKYSGRWDTNIIFIEKNNIEYNDNVSPVVLGFNNWASAWALDKNNYPLYPVVPGGEKQREIAYRFGINLSMYALTGNYKSDQVHSKSILNRLR